MLMRRPARSTAATPYSAPAAVYANTTCERTRSPAIHAALGLAPTAWKRRPGAVKRSTSATAIVSAAPAQKTELTPSGLSDAHDESDSGTCNDTVCSRAYFELYATAICPTASVTISGLSLTIPTRIPLARPTSAPSPSATMIPTVNPWPEPTLTPTSTFPQSEITPAVDRSMPACMTTSICPTAAIARIVP